ncbi:MAG: pyrroloquinoline quinone-dependent dehydrogenase, partial [Imperialibacter sp.]
MDRYTLPTSLPKCLSWLTLILSTVACSPKKQSGINWPEYNGGPDRNHYSELTQFNKENVNRMGKAWEYSSGGADTTKNQTQIQCNPIIIDGILYGVSAGSQAFALDAASGQELWKTNFNDKTFSMTSRGVTYQADETGKRIFFGYGHLLYCLDAKTGKPISSFGDNGK